MKLAMLELNSSRLIEGASRISLSQEDFEMTLDDETQIVFAEHRTRKSKVLIFPALCAFAKVQSADDARRLDAKFHPAPKK